MATPSITNSLAKVSQYLWSVDIATKRAFCGGTINNGKDIIMYLERKALEYGIDNSLSNIQGVSQYVYSLIGGKLQLANQAYSSGSGGIIVNPSTGTSTLSSLYIQFVVGDIGALLVAGSTTFTINIGVGNVFQDGAFQIYCDQVLLPRNNNNYLSYQVSYAAGIITVVLNAAAQTGQLYQINGTYLIV